MLSSDLVDRLFVVCKAIVAVLNSPPPVNACQWLLAKCLEMCNMFDMGRSRTTLTFVSYFSRGVIKPGPSNEPVVVALC